MKVGFYYHIPITGDKERILVPSYLGVFLDSLAGHIDHLYLIMHECKGAQVAEADYSLKRKNITWINLGFKTPAWHRVLFHKKILKSKHKEMEICDVMLVRSPSPLSSYFHRYLRKPKLCFMVVGDYMSGLRDMNNGGFRELMVKAFLLYNNWLFEKRIKRTDIIVNSPALYKKYEYAKSVGLIKTTTLLDSDFFVRADTCQNQVIEILYSGRFDRAKGLFELIDAVAELRNEGFNIRCNIVGVEIPSQVSIRQALIERSEELGIENFLIFHGMKTIGIELNKIYRMADIYVIPSYHEGFPRTIWEAMANSLPVIATTVGAIPYFLKNEETALIIQPKDIDAIKNAVINIIQKPELRKSLIANGLILAKEATQEKQTLVLISLLKGLS